MLKEITRSLDKFFIISQQPLFLNLTEKQRVFVANRTQVVEYDKNDVVYKKGQKKNNLYIVITGRIELFHPGRKKNGRAHVFETLMKGDCFGLISLLTGRQHSVSARVLNDARLIRIGHEAFDEIVKEIPALESHFNKILSRRLREKHAGDKEIFQRTILAVHCPGDEKYASSYAASLGQALAGESGKKVAMLSFNKNVDSRLRQSGLKMIYMANPRSIAAVVSNLACEHHFVVIDLPGKLDAAERMVLKQADICHAICNNERKEIRDAVALLRGLGKSEKFEIKIVLKKAAGQPEIKGLDTNAFSVNVMPAGKKDYARGIRRIARELSGKRLGLALGAGGALGLAQLGVLDVLEKNNVKIDLIAGTSMGSLVGAFWASGFKAQEIEKILSTFDTRAKAIGLLDPVVPNRGLIGGQNVRAFISKYLGDRTFEDTLIPLRVVACDIEKRDEVVISSGKLVDAVMASIAIPGIFNPFVTEDGKFLVDGGIVNPVPISVLAREGVKRIIAVNSMPSPEDTMKATISRYTVFDLIVNSIYSMEYRIGKYAAEEADVYIHPIMKDAGWYEFYRIKEFVSFGRKKAGEALPGIKKLIRN